MIRLTKISRAKENIKSSGGNIKQEYELFKGFAAELPDDHVSTLSSHPEVEHVEKDQEVSIQ